MQKPSFEGLDRRRFPRIPFWYIVKYKEDPHEKKSFNNLFTSRTKNISAGGILLETNKYYPVSTLIEVELDVPLDSNNHVYAKVIGSVIRCAEVEKDKTYDTAVQFVSIPREHRSSILRLIDAFI